MKFSGHWHCSLALFKVLWWELGLQVRTKKLKRKIVRDITCKTGSGALESVKLSYFQGFSCRTPSVPVCAAQARRFGPLRWRWRKRVRTWRVTQAVRCPWPHSRLLVMKPGSKVKQVTRLFHLVSWLNHSVLFGYILVTCAVAVKDTSPGYTLYPCNQMNSPHSEVKW